MKTWGGRQSILQVARLSARQQVLPREEVMSSGHPAVTRSGCPAATGTQKLPLLKALTSLLGPQHNSGRMAWHLCLCSARLPYGSPAYLCTQVCYSQRSRHSNKNNQHITLSSFITSHSRLPRKRTPKVSSHCPKPIVTYDSRNSRTSQHITL